MLGHVGVGPAQQRGVVGVVGVRGPDLGAVDQEVVALVNRSGLDRSQIRAVVGLRQALTPDLLGRRDLGNKTLLLLRRAPLHQRRSDPGDALKIDRGRRFGPIQLFVVDDLLDQAGPASAVLLGPVDTHPAPVVQLTVPGPAAFKLLLGVRVVQLAVVPPVARDVGLKPAPKLLAKAFFLRAKTEIHACALSCLPPVRSAVRQLGQQFVQVQAAAAGLKIALGVARPVLGRPVDRQLHPVAVRVGQIHGLGHAVVGGALQRVVGLAQGADRTGQLLPVGVENGKVIQPGMAGAGADSPPVRPRY